MFFIEEKSIERQYVIIGYRFDTTGIFGYTFYSESGNICSASSIVVPSAPVLIHGGGVTWRSEFDDGMTIVPGIARSINDESNGTQLYRIVYKSRGEYEINDSLIVYCDTGRYAFYSDDKVIAMIRRFTGEAGYSQIISDTYPDHEPFFIVTADNRIGKELLMVILAFPMLQFAF